MRRISCLIGCFFALCALAVAVWEVLGRAEGEPLSLRPAGELWYRVDVASLNLVQAVIERYIWPPLWDPVIATVLQWPALAVFALPAVLCFALCAWRAWRARGPRRPS